MFTFVHDTASLIFKNEFIELCCTPDGIEREHFYKNGYDSEPPNGEFNFTFNDKDIFFNCSKYGCGQGGSLSITLKMTSEIKESLDKAFRDMKDYTGSSREEALAAIYDYSSCA